MNDLRSERDSSPAHRAHFDPTDSGHLSSTIAAAIATATDRPPRSITPLYEAIDPEALEELLEHAATAPADAPSFDFEFAIDGTTVIVAGDGTISVYDCGECDAEDDGGPESGLEFSFDG